MALKESLLLQGIAVDFNQSDDNNDGDYGNDNGNENDNVYDEEGADDIFND